MSLEAQVLEVTVKVPSFLLGLLFSVKKRLVGPSPELAMAFTLRSRKSTGVRVRTKIYSLIPHFGVLSPNALRC
jgi:hypothetical protein